MNLQLFLYSLTVIISTVGLRYTAAAQTIGSQLTDASASRASAVQIATDSGGVFAPHRQNQNFERVGMRPGQSATITAQFPISMATQSVEIAPLDGGAVDKTSGQIASDGTLSFRFRAPTAIGHCRILVHCGDAAGQIVQFWVRDLANPQNNPPVYPGS